MTAIFCEAPSEATRVLQLGSLLELFHLVAQLCRALNKSVASLNRKACKLGRFGRQHPPTPQEDNFQITGITYPAIFTQAVGEFGSYEFSSRTCEILGRKKRIIFKRPESYYNKNSQCVQSDLVEKVLLQLYNFQTYPVTVKPQEVSQEMGSAAVK